jgi:hypothetical protein
MSICHFLGRLNRGPSTGLNSSCTKLYLQTYLRSRFLLPSSSDVYRNVSYPTIPRGLFLSNPPRIITRLTFARTPCLLLTGRSVTPQLLCLLSQCVSSSSSSLSVSNVVREDDDLDIEFYQDFIASPQNSPPAVHTPSNLRHQAKPGLPVGILFRGLPQPVQPL